MFFFLQVENLSLCIDANADYSSIHPTPFPCSLARVLRRLFLCLPSSPRFLFFLVLFAMKSHVVRDGGVAVRGAGRKETKGKLYTRVGSTCKKIGNQTKQLSLSLSEE